ncbi:Pre-mRNA-splicing factor CWC22 -like protein [Trichinella murrelli]|uniref:Lethal protein 858 n=1 Tax=Trichinella murrelli TaxID=144512 RepID=A0A0V0UGY0_9BILA|nr:Pre-mRNA-splicing factor CWC22 -like protein [Trichinella murrelli]
MSVDAEEDGTDLSSRKLISESSDAKHSSKGRHRRRRSSSFDDSAPRGKVKHRRHEKSKDYSRDEREHRSTENRRKYHSNRERRPSDEGNGSRNHRHSDRQRHKQRRRDHDTKIDRSEEKSDLKSTSTQGAVKDGAAMLAEWRKRKQASGCKAGGAYITPSRLKQMQDKLQDKNSYTEEYQRLSWERLKKIIGGQINRANVDNIVVVIRTLLSANILRGKGAFCRSLLQAQAYSPRFSNVYAALVAVVNSKFPSIGELLLRRVINQFKRNFRRQDAAAAVSSCKLIAHLINQNVVHEVLALELLTCMLENPTEESIEMAVEFLRECGAKLTELTPRGMNAVFDRLRSILHESDIRDRVQYMIETIFQIRKDKFAANPPIIEGLDLVEEDDEITHTISLDDEFDNEDLLNVFQFDPDFQKNEEKYEEIRAELLGSDESGDEEEEEDAEMEDESENKTTKIVDMTETNLVAFRRTVYLTIQSSLDFQEAITKLLKMEIRPEFELEMCHMILDCCAQQRTYEKFFGLMAERFCILKKSYMEHFEQMFRDIYGTVHRFELTKLRNTTKMFAHLLYTDAISWTVLSVIKLNEDDTTSSGRIFVKILFQELAEYMGLDSLYERIEDATLQPAFEGLFPRDNPRHTRFSINFFTSIGLGGLTIGLREHLKA